MQARRGRRTILGLLQLGALVGFVTFTVLIGGLMWPGSPLWANLQATATPSYSATPSPTPTAWGSGGPTITPPWTPTPSTSPSPTPTHSPGYAYLSLLPKDPSPTATPTMTPPGELGLVVSWESPLEPPQPAFTITIELVDADAGQADWVLEDVAGNIAQGRLYHGQSTTVQLEIDWNALPLELGGARNCFVLALLNGEGDGVLLNVLAVPSRPMGCFARAYVRSSQRPSMCRMVIISQA